MQEPAEVGGGPSVSGNKSPWNSLEVVKIIMSAATPIAIAALGIMVSAQNSQESIAREANARKESIARDDQTRREAVQRDQEARREAILRGQVAADQAFQRETSLRDEGFRREDQIRRQALIREQFQRLADRRMEFWQKVSSKLAEVDRIVAIVAAGDQNAEQRRSLVTNLRRIMRECDDIFIIYSPYYSGGLGIQYRLYKAAVQDLMLFLQATEDRGMRSGGRIIDEMLRPQYERLLTMGAAEVASLSQVPVR